MGIARYQYQFHNVPPIWSQKGRTTVEWTWWRYRNSNNKVCPPQSFLANSVPATAKYCQWHIHLTHLFSPFKFKSCESAVLCIVLLEVACKLSHFCKMARRSKVVGPRWHEKKLDASKNSCFFAREDGLTGSSAEIDRCLLKTKPPFSKVPVWLHLDA